MMVSVGDSWRAVNYKGDGHAYGDDAELNEDSADDADGENVDNDGYADKIL